MSETLYDILGLSKDCTSQEIKKEYRKLSMKLHPDKTNDLTSHEKFKKINEAYEILGDEERRKKYDMELKFEGINLDFFDKMFGGPMGMGMGMPPPPFGMNMKPGRGPKVQIFTNMSDIPTEIPLCDIFEPANVMNALNKPSPILKSIEVTFAQIFLGASLPLQVERWNSINGVKQKEMETIYVNIPKGIDDGELIILREKGNSINNNVFGDLKIVAKVLPHPYFGRTGLDLIYKKEIDLKEALTGFSFEITHLNGKSYTLNNIQNNIITPGFRKTIPNMGFVRENHNGNLIVEFSIKFPKSLSIEQVEKLKEIL